MSDYKKISSLFKRFTTAQSGTIAVMYAMVSVPICLAVGVAVDYGRYSVASTQLQNALDTATLAAASAKDLTNAKRIALAKEVFVANTRSGLIAGMDAKPDVEIKNGKVFASVNSELPTSFMQLAGITKMDAVAKTEVTIPIGKKAEIALVLDYSGSMEEISGGQVKYIAMKKAAIGLVKDLEKENKDKVKFGLVPFSHQVYTSLPAAYVAGETSGTWTGCTEDRPSPDNTSATTPGSDNSSKWGQPVAANFASYGCNGYQTRGLKIRPLTDNFAAVSSQLDRMRPYYGTHIAVGVEFGFHVLSPNAPYSEGVSYSDKETEKYMVVLTDGRQTAFGFGPNGVRNEEQGELNLTSLCTNAKAEGITMITIAFDLRNKATATLLRNCSSEPSKHYFEAEGGADIAQVFKSIKEAITAEIFISK